MKIPKPRPIRLSGRDTSGDECRVCGRHEHEHHDFEPPRGLLPPPDLTPPPVSPRPGWRAPAPTSPRLTPDRNDPRLRQIGPDGKQEAYLILSDEERARGFVRPVRRSYRHETCGAVTYMADALAETYARDPNFYGATYCCACRDHYPVGEHGEFVWDETDIKVGA